MKVPTTIIGFGHQRRRGKDLSARFAYEWFDRQDIPVRFDSFAWPLKEGIGRVIFGLTAEQISGPLKAIKDSYWGRSPREIFQLGGTEAMRKVFGEDIWVKSLMRRLVPDAVTLVTDVRFPNEADAIRQRDGLVFRVDRPAIEVPFDPDQDNHESETALLDYPYWTDVINNDAGIEGLREKVEVLLASHFA